MKIPYSNIFNQETNIFSFMKQEYVLRGITFKLWTNIGNIENNDIGHFTAASFLNNQKAEIYLISL